MISKSFGFATIGIHHKYIEIAKAITGKSNLFAIVAPYRHIVMRFMHG